MPNPDSLRQATMPHSAPALIQHVAAAAHPPDHSPTGISDSRLAPPAMTEVRTNPPQTLPAPPRLIGVGVGPGDPELLTLKAVRALEAADIILVPDADTRDAASGRAETIVVAACPGVTERIRRIPFSMTIRHGVDQRRQEAWQRSADEALRAFAEGACSVVFATVGDPSVYSTFSYLAATVRHVVRGCTVSVVPGITAMQALAAASLTPLVEGQEVLALVPVTAGLAPLERALDLADTVVAYKVGRNLTAVTDLLRDRDRVDAAILGMDIGLPGETISVLADLNDDTAPYFSTLIIPALRTHTGARI